MEAIELIDRILPIRTSAELLLKRATCALAAGNIPVLMESASEATLAIRAESEQNPAERDSGLAQARLKGLRAMIEASEYPAFRRRRSDVLNQVDAALQAVF
jgi:hypothetical protein